jgi:hypothetical protein
MSREVPIELVDKGGKSFHGRLTLVENALRNLVENATGIPALAQG